MKYYVMTLFPEMIQRGMDNSILGKAMEKGLIELETVNIRDYAGNRYGKVDDYPYGGGAGMVLQPEPVYQAFEAIRKKAGRRPRTIYLTPQGRPFCQELVEEFAREPELVFLCGHYEGIDERVLEETVTDYVSIGDYVLTGGELPAMVMMDAISRFVPGVLSNQESAQFESFQDNLLEYPHYTRPAVWRGKEVPQVLLSGAHDSVETWRAAQSVRRTRERRPDLLAGRYRLVAAVFSPTEGTSQAVRWFAEAFGQEVLWLDLNRPEVRRQEVVLEERDVLLAASPVYAGQLPPVEGLFQNLRGQGNPCVLLAGYGNRHYDDMLAQLAYRLKKQGFFCIGAMTAIVPHIFAPKITEGRPSQEDRRAVEEFAQLIWERLEAPKRRRVKLPGNACPAPKAARPVKKELDRARCLDCGICAEECPAEALDRDTLDCDESLCISCMRCARVCPANARSFDAAPVERMLTEKCGIPRKPEIF